MPYQGTWQFMSVELLTNLYKCVEVPDDLESFFLVLLYYAIRYLDSNVKDAGDYIEEFFDTFTLQDGVYTVGTVKRHTMKAGLELTTTPGAGSEKLVFNLPLDGLFKTLLRSFQTAYKIREYDSRLPVDPLSSNIVAKVPPQTPVEMSMILMTEGLMLPETLIPETTVEAAPARPTDHERKLARNATNHLEMIVLLRQALSCPWPKAKVFDRVPADRNSTQKYGPTVTPSNEPRARLKVSRFSISLALSNQSQIEEIRHKIKRRKVSNDDAEEAQGEAGATKPKKVTRRERPAPRAGTRKSARLVNMGQ